MKQCSNLQKFTYMSFRLHRVKQNQALKTGKWLANSENI